MGLELGLGLGLGLGSAASLLRPEADGVVVGGRHEAQHAARRHLALEVAHEPRADAPHLVRVRVRARVRVRVRARARARVRARVWVRMHRTWKRRITAHSSSSAKPA